MAERVLVTLFAKLIWAFDYSHKLDTAGKPIPVNIDPETAYRDGFLNKVYPFEMVATPRSAKREEVMIAAAKKAEAEVLSQYHV